MENIKKLIALFLATIIVFSVLPESSVLASENQFGDIQSDAYYYDAVLWAVENGITAGTSATTFSPNAKCTRGQVVTFLWRANGEPEPKESYSPFKDVGSKAYYYNAVLWAVEKGITAGTSATKFSPDKACTRGQVVTFLHRAQGEPMPTSANCQFTDINDDAYYYDAVLWAVENKITAGTSETKFSPEKTCTRGQIVTFLFRAINSIEEQNHDEFYDGVADIVKEYTDPDWSIEEASEDAFYFGRLIVRSSSAIDFTPFHPVDYVENWDNLYIVQFANSEDAESAFYLLSNMPEVIYVEPDGYVVEDYVVEDGITDGEYRASQSHSWGIHAIGADKLAEYVSSFTSASITVAVVDSGVSDHPFLKGRILWEDGYDFVDHDRTPIDEHGHGTHVAGTIVDCTPGLNVKILPVRVLNEEKNTPSGYIPDTVAYCKSIVGAGIMYAVDHGADVINLSLGGQHYNAKEEAIRYAVSKGVCVISTAGNNNTHIGNYCPAHIDSVITIGSVDANLQKAADSNFGEGLDIVCPGVGIESCNYLGGFITQSGTSMAAPHASAAVAMLRLLYPWKSQGEIKRMLCSHTVDLGDPGWDAYYGWGLPDLEQFIPLTAEPKEGQIGPNAFYRLESVGEITQREWDDYYEEWYEWTFEGYKMTIYGKGETYDKDSMLYWDDFHPMDGEIVSIVVEDGITSIGDDLFQENGFLTSLKLPDSVTRIGDRAFESCDRLQNLTLPANLQVLGELAFGICYELNHVVIPKNTKLIASNTFYFTSPDLQIEVEEGNKYFCVVGNVLYSKDMKTLVFYPAGNPQEEFTIPDGVESIGNCSSSSAFNFFEHPQQTLKTVIVPASVNFISGEAFFGVNVRFLGAPPEFEEGFTGIHSYEYENGYGDIGCQQFGSHEKIQVYYPNTEEWQKTIRENFRGRRTRYLEFVPYSLS